MSIIIINKSRIKTRSNSIFKVGESDKERFSSEKDAIRHAKITVSSGPIQSVTVYEFILTEYLPEHSERVKKSSKEYYLNNSTIIIR